MSASNQPPTGQIIIYQAEDGRSAIRVRLQDDAVWMTRNLMAELYQTTQQNISLHVRNVFEENELREASVVMEAASPAAGATAGAARATGAATRWRRPSLLAGGLPLESWDAGALNTGMGTITVIFCQMGCRVGWAVLSPQGRGNISGQVSWLPVEATKCSGS